MRSKLCDVHFKDHVHFMKQAVRKGKFFRAFALKAAAKTKAEDRKLCRGLVRSCRGGLSVTPAIASKALRVRLLASFKHVRVYCRHCLRIYAQRYVGFATLKRRHGRWNRSAVALKPAAKTKAEDRKRKKAETHWSGQSTSKRTRETWTRAEDRISEDRKLCRGLVRSCRGGLSVTPAIASKALRLHLFASFKRVRVYCRHCLRIYAHRYVES